MDAAQSHARPDLEEPALTGSLVAPMRSALQGLTTLEARGRVTEVLGTLVRATGIQARVGELCELRTREGRSLCAEVIGFRGATAILTPFGDLSGLSNRSEVIALRRSYQVNTGRALLGRVLDGFGNPIDGRGPPGGEWQDAIDADPPDALTRKPVIEVCETRVRAIDTLLTVGRGQRMGLFAPVGVGKTTLIGMLARGAQADVNVIALVGERGREVGEFVQHILGAEGLKRSVVVVATSDRPAIERVKSAQVATTIAERFRREGLHVLLLMDSITRYARALREIGLASGEAPTRRGFPPSVFAALPKLLERAGNDAHGAITAFYTLLVEGEEDTDPIAEEVRSLLDGHLNLSRAQAQAHHFPAIDVLASLSRVMPALISREQLDAAARIRGWLAKHRDIELLVQMGEYRHGADMEADEAIARAPSVRKFLRQAPDELADFDASREALAALMGHPDVD
jgi:ATP synthase in type III secretion protein N